MSGNQAPLRAGASRREYRESSGHSYDHAHHACLDQLGDECVLQLGPVFEAKGGGE